MDCIDFVTLFASYKYFNSILQILKCGLSYHLFLSSLIFLKIYSFQCIILFCFINFISNYFFLCMHAKSIQSCLTLYDFSTVVCQVSPSIQFFRLEYWGELSCLSLGDLPNLGIEPTSLTSPAFAGGLFTISTTWEAPCKWN